MDVCRAAWARLGSYSYSTYFNALKSAQLSVENHATYLKFFTSSMVIIEHSKAILRKCKIKPVGINQRQEIMSSLDNMCLSSMRLNLQMASLEITKEEI